MKKTIAALGTAALLGALAAAPAGATNGMDMIGYGTRSIGMGGADVAVAGDAAAASAATRRRFRRRRRVRRTSA